MVRQEQAGPRIMWDMSWNELPRRAVATLALWAARGRERRRLEDLDDHLLADLGISRAAATREASRPPWSGAPRDERRSDRPRGRLAPTLRV
jgi:uncharacterized protein YjiS (DUF1127 family)